jgi:hypothetical protein
VRRGPGRGKDRRARERLDGLHRRGESLVVSRSGVGGVVPDVQRGDRARRRATDRDASRVDPEPRRTRTEEAHRGLCVLHRLDDSNDARLTRVPDASFGSEPVATLRSKRADGARRTPGVTVEGESLSSRTAVSFAPSGSRPGVDGGGPHAISQRSAGPAGRVSRSEVRVRGERRGRRCLSLRRVIRSRPAVGRSSR